MAAAAPTSAEEVAELDRLLFRLVMTPEERVGAAIQEHLPLLLDRLGTEDAAVRNKVGRLMRLPACLAILPTTPLKQITAASPSTAPSRASRSRRPWRTRCQAWARCRT